MKDASETLINMGPEVLTTHHQGIEKKLPL